MERGGRGEGAEGDLNNPFEECNNNFSPHQPYLIYEFFANVHYFVFFFFLSLLSHFFFFFLYIFENGTQTRKWNFPLKEAQSSVKFKFTRTPNGSRGFDISDSYYSYRGTWKTLNFETSEKWNRKCIANERITFPCSFERQKWNLWLSFVKLKSTQAQILDGRKKTIFPIEHECLLSHIKTLEEQLVIFNQTRQMRTTILKFTMFTWKHCACNQAAEMFEGEKKKKTETNKKRKYALHEYFMGQKEGESIGCRGTA